MFKSIKLVSMQVGKVVEYENMKSAFNKNIYLESAKVTSLGLEEDEVADKQHHGDIDKAVFTNSFNNYSSWKEFLSLAQLPFGALGENLTIDGLDESNVLIGDIHQIGDVILQVSQPRKPCWKISQRWDNKKFTKYIYDTGKTGWYYRVLQEGSINKEDSFLISKKDKDNISIALANKIYKDPRIDETIVECLLESKSLAMAWKEGLLKRVKNSENDPVYMQRP